MLSVGIAIKFAKHSEICSEISDSRALIYFLMVSSVTLCAWPRVVLEGGKKRDMDN